MPSRPIKEYDPANAPAAGELRPALVLVVLIMSILSYGIWKSESGFDRFRDECAAHGGDKTEIVREGPQCWDTKTGRRLFFDKAP